MIIWLSLLVCVLGAFVFALSANPKLAELGKLSFFAGLFVFLLQLPQHAVTFLR